jgi:CDP-diacylglycerol pyrophosphatase
MEGSMQALRYLATWLGLALALAGCASPSIPLPPPPAHPNGQALWRIIHEQCVPGQLAHNTPAPCEVVSVASGEAHGFVVLKDRVGATQYLLMPTAKITGIEDAAILKPDATNYFAEAWDERGLVESRARHTLDRSQISIAVNSVYGRSQDQLHLHIDCLDGSVGRALEAANIPRTSRWAEIELKGHRYHVRWLGAGELASTNPFKLLASTMPGARRGMGAWTIALVGASGRDGAQGFYLLADRADPVSGDSGSAEELQDHDCGL